MTPGAAQGSGSGAERLRADVGRAACENLLLVFGDQLTTRVPAFDAIDVGRDVVMMAEVAEEATHVASHRQRTTLFLSAMRHFALELVEAGHRVRYVRLDDAHNTQSLDAELRRAAEMLEPERVHVTRPGEHRVMGMVESWKSDLGVPVEVHEDTHFLVTPGEFERWASERKSLVMEHFYRERRRRQRVLLTKDGSPVGGSWNYDKENRRAFKRAPEVRTPYMARPDAVTREVMALVERRFPDAPGRMESFGWPVTRREARRALRDFIERRLPGFGAHQDAMWSGEPWLSHSRLSAAINLHLLDPGEVVDAAIEAYEAGDAPLNSVEGFVRQIIGWREFIRGVYWSEGPGYPERNGLGHDGALPEFYWTGRTEMSCMRDSVGQVLDHAYGHHIQRLMVTGNFALIAGIDPGAVRDWYLGMYVDAVDWVTAPNTVGMALHADGGVVGTKPYAASGKYIQRMSNACGGCRYDPSQRTGEKACPFSTFYWDFLLRHERRFRSNPRMNLTLKNLDRLTDAEKRAIREHASTLRGRLGIA